MQIGVFIGRFQPFHLGHYHIIHKALEVVEHLVVVIGSHDSPRTYHNPFTTSERMAMILDSLTLEERDRVSFGAVEDALYNDVAWIEQVRTIVSDVCTGATDPQIVLVGHRKDSTSYYLDMFPDWSCLEISNSNGINSTDIRRDYFGLDQGNIAAIHLPVPVTKALIAFEQTPEYKTLKREHQYITGYRQAWAGAPYTPIFVTVDAVVFCSSHILLVRRRSEPGKGLWAFPGGFLNSDETIDAGTLRELHEETGLKVPPAVLQGSIKTRKVFDSPRRSARGRVITNASLIVINPKYSKPKLPKVKGSDDADLARWFPSNDVTRQMMFEDHFDIFQFFKGML